MDTRKAFTNYIHDLQNRICTGLEQADGGAVFREDAWTRPEGGGGRTRIIHHGNVFEKGGVNTSVVHGPVSDIMRRQLGIDGDTWFACGLSLVIHPRNPYVPTVHANWRYFELYDKEGKRIDSWFGGGADLTPYYIFEEDGRHFHTVLKNTLDRFDTGYYPAFKKNCDEYFINKHRGDEARGIGGIFYDHLRPADNMEEEKLLSLQRANGDAFLDGYLPIVVRRKNMPYGERETEWQEIRRGRYVEFNLVHDRGTLFGLKTNGRTESILMSLPERARWYYDYQPEPGTPEATLLEYLKPRNWIAN